SSRRRHTTSLRDWSSDVCSSDLDLLDWHHAYVHPNNTILGLDLGGIEIACESNNSVVGMHVGVVPIQQILPRDCGNGGIFRNPGSEERRVGQQYIYRWSAESCNR